MEVRGARAPFPEAEAFQREQHQDSRGGRSQRGHVAGRGATVFPERVCSVFPLEASGSNQMVVVGLGGGSLPDAAEMLLCSLPISAEVLTVPGRAWLLSSSHSPPLADTGPGA